MPLINNVGLDMLGMRANNAVSHRFKFVAKMACGMVINVHAKKHTILSMVSAKDVLLEADMMELNVHSLREDNVCFPMKL